MTDIEKWGDSAMWLAEPQKKTGPTAILIHMTERPLQVMAAAAELYQGRVVRNPQEISRETAERWFTDMTKTKLAASLEFIDLHFLLEGVSRAFTHQLVRQRTAVYVQESLRFAVVEDLPVGVPPSLQALKEDDPRRVVWTDTIDEIANSYMQLIGAGIPAEDARSILPTNTLTRVHYKTNLRNLADHAGNRLCTQAQFEWRQVWAQMIKAVRSYGVWPPSQEWQFERIAELFKPVCFQTGRCQFRSMADRACSIRDRVEEHWHRGEEPEQWTDIAPREWLADPNAAR